MVQTLYAMVDNLVMFSPFESDIYEVNNGVNQGYVLSPCLFNLVIADRDTMLNGNGGVEFGANMISGLCYTDDIVLFPENEWPAGCAPYC